MAETWIGIINSTKPKYTKGASDLTLRSRLLLSLFKRKGKIEYNQHSFECRWQSEFSQPPMLAHGDGGVVDFTNHDAFRQRVLDWRGYILTDAISKKQRAMNKGDSALINLFETKQNRLMKSAMANFNAEMFKSGITTGRENCIHGVETFTGAGTTVAADRVAKPDGSYAGFDTDVADQGGTWSNSLTPSPNASIAKDWPDGQGDTEFDWNSPKLVNYSSTNWGTSLTTWEANSWRVISQTITWLTLTGGDDGSPDICLLAPNLFQGFKNSQEAIRRLTIPQKSGDDFGFKGTLNMDGTILQTDFDCPVNTGYMINISQQTLSSMFEQLFWIEGPDADARSGWSHLWGTGFYGNMKWEPKHIAKIYPFA